LETQGLDNQPTKASQKSEFVSFSADLERARDVTANALEVALQPEKTQITYAYKKVSPNAKEKIPNPLTKTQQAPLEIIKLKSKKAVSPRQKIMRTTTIKKGLPIKAKKSVPRMLATEPIVSEIPPQEPEERTKTVPTLPSPGFSSTHETLRKRNVAPAPDVAIYDLHNDITVQIAPGSKKDTDTIPHREQKIYIHNSAKEVSFDVYEITKVDASNEVGANVPEIIAELFMEMPDTDKPDDANNAVNAPTSVHIEIASKHTDETFAARLMEYVDDLPKNPESVTLGQPAELLEKMVKTSLKIQKLQEQEPNLETLQEAIEDLTGLCVEFLKNIGVEPREKTVALLVEKMLTSDYTNIKIAQLSPEELAKLGTHEYKLEDWFHRFKQVVDNSIHPRQLVGRAAVRLVLVS
jgi:hypothetical protein